ncbi:MAG: NADPH-quinone oxidoreductase [Synechococcus sp. SB0673_bin_10]|nr:NADPH-quinone oxidoreductase [Synechococcus sp. SB0667_bin_8]MYF36725.1 NADPH-quinone oxidoreductase [Synechococcus sp. SB0678_bin_12]MYG64863.1 NADPH-quinone oxidoreductase [Synechococcus sp. SB0675_bin_7]MYI72176.1 NADPH-quinone oxidoreductase [Synechococcus sp. SB0673_bin_10]MYI88671.1 NADPH-quinone oxidoreductase [Synechococcus sp. SB0672_bin_10]MYK84812.1 NADPH-quinone oxidoreductase [Synechococcus sp. SB0669_bin_7]
MPMPSLETLLLPGLVGALGFVYLIVTPAALMAWLHRRWHVMGKVERLLSYALVFLLFPGLILLAPFVNLRPAGRHGEP